MCRLSCFASGKRSAAPALVPGLTLLIALCAFCPAGASAAGKTPPADAPHQKTDAAPQKASAAPEKPDSVSPTADAAKEAEDPATGQNHPPPPEQGRIFFTDRVELAPGVAETLEQAYGPESFHNALAAQTGGTAVKEAAPEASGNGPAGEAARRLAGLIRHKLEAGGLEVSALPASPPPRPEHAGEAPPAGTAPAASKEISLAPPALSEKTVADHPSLADAEKLPLVPAGESSAARPPRGEAPTSAEESSVAPLPHETVFTGIEPAGPAAKTGQPPAAHDPQLGRSTPPRSPAPGAPSPTAPHSPAPGASSPAAFPQTGAAAQNMNALPDGSLMISVLLDHAEGAGWSGSTVIAGQGRAYTRLVLGGRVTVRSARGDLLLQKNISAVGRVNVAAGQEMGHAHERTLRAALEHFAENVAAALPLEKYAAGTGGEHSDSGSGRNNETAIPAPAQKSSAAEDRAAYQDSPGKRLKPK